MPPPFSITTQILAAVGRKADFVFVNNEVIRSK
jgi:hypothetical protein